MQGFHLSEEKLIARKLGHDRRGCEPIGRITIMHSVAQGLVMGYSYQGLALVGLLAAGKRHTSNGTGAGVLFCRFAGGSLLTGTMFRTGTIPPGVAVPGVATIPFRLVPGEACMMCLKPLPRCAAY